MQVGIAHVFHAAAPSRCPPSVFVRRSALLAESVAERAERDGKMPRVELEILLRETSPPSSVVLPLVTRKVSDDVT